MKEQPVGSRTEAVILTVVAIIPASIFGFVGATMLAVSFVDLPGSLIALPFGLLFLTASVFTLMMPWLFKRV